MTLSRLPHAARCLIAVAVLLAGCVSAKSTPIRAISDIQGNWNGTITTGSGSQQFYYLTINPDATMVAQWGLNWAWGKITLRPDGIGAFELQNPTTGTIQYYAGPGPRSLVLKPTFEDWSVYVTPVR